MSTLGRLYRAETSIGFVGQARRWFIVSGVALLLCLGSLAIRGFNLSLDFTGGTAITMPNPAGAGVGEVRSVLGPMGSTARVQLIDDGAAVRVQTEAIDLETEREMVRTLVSVTGTEIELTDVESVGPTFGRQIARRALQALGVFLGVVVVFISIRFEWKMAVGAIAALLHDLVLTAGAYSLLGFEVTPATVVAVLTILGYSLYDTVVVYDKIRENIAEDQERRTYSALVDRSMNQVLMRSINTSLTSLLPVGSLLFIGSALLGAGTLREFALALFVGIGAGTYSSIFIAAPLLALWKERETEWSRRRYRSERKASRRTVSGSGRGGPAPRPGRLSSRGQRIVGGRNRDRKR